MGKLPELFIERLGKIIPKEYLESVLNSFTYAKPITARINSIKKDPKEVYSFLEEHGIEFTTVPWYENGVILQNISEEYLNSSSLFKDGTLYRQNLSSMLIPLLLGPEKGENILDMCAAPGSKTTQIAAMIENKGKIIAIENIKNRLYKLKSVIEIQGAQNVTVKLMDARKYRSDELFDRILVDAPCSSEGRFNLSHKKTYAYWSKRKILEMRKKQRGIALNAFRLLKKDGTMVYSTCTFAPEENEGVIDWLLRKTNRELEIEDLFLNDIETYPCLSEWEGRQFNQAVKNCVRILPNGIMNGFFIAKIRKL